VTQITRSERLILNNEVESLNVGKLHVPVFTAFGCAFNHTPPPLNRTGVIRSCSRS